MSTRQAIRFIAQTIVDTIPAAVVDQLVDSFDEQTTWSIDPDKSTVANWMADYLRKPPGDK